MKPSNFLGQAISTILVVSISLANFNFYTVKAEESLETLRNDKKSLVEEEIRINDILESLKKDDSRKEELIKQLEEQINIIHQQIDIENKRNFLLDKEINEKEELIKLSQKKIEEHMEKFKQRLRAIFKAGGDTAFISTILKANSIKDLINTADVIQIIGKHDSRLSQELNAEMQRINEEKIEVEKKKQDICDSKISLEKKRKDLEKIQEDNKRILEERRQKELRQKELAARQALRKRRLHNECLVDYSNIQSNGKYIWPVPGYNGITSYWGDNRGHKGIDIASSGIYGAAIVASSNGVVIVSNSSDQWGSGWGYHVKIDHGSGYATQYSHCSLIVVSVGQQVKAGQVIGYVGNTGNSYGAHLHFETWKDRVRYNPMIELK